MEKLREIFKNIIKQHKKSLKDPNVEDVKVLGKGYFGVVFDYGQAVFKLTREGEYDAVANSSNIINYLAEKGVNCPKHYMVEEYEINMNPRKFMAILHQTINKSEFYGDKEALYKLLENIEEHNSEKEKGKLVGMFQEKIKGFSPFTHLHRKIEYLEFLQSMPEEHLYKFVLDADKLIQNGINIDNCSKSNYIYTKDKGFYFIDLDGSDYGMNCPFSCTIGNCLDELNSIAYQNSITYKNEEVAKKVLDLAFKLYDVTKKIYLGNLNNEVLKSRAEVFLRNKFNSYLNLGKMTEYLSNDIKDVYSEKISKIYREIYVDLENQKNSTFYPQV